MPLLLVALVAKGMALDHMTPVKKFPVVGKALLQDLGSR